MATATVTQIECRSRCRYRGRRSTDIAMLLFDDSGSRDLPEIMGEHALNASPML
jgi:hypothetical protein